MVQMRTILQKTMMVACKKDIICIFDTIRLVNNSLDFALVTCIKGNNTPELGSSIKFLNDYIEFKVVSLLIRS